MDCDCLLAFAANQLSDLARRSEPSGRFLRGHRRQINVNGEKRKAPLRGIHICYQGDEKRADGKPRFRDVDSKRRLFLAVSALEHYLIEHHHMNIGINRQACLMSSEFLFSAPFLPLRSVLAVGRRGRRARPVMPIGTTTPSTQVSHSSGCRDPRFTELDRQIQSAPWRKSKLPENVRKLAKTIYNEAREWRKANPDYKHGFICSFGAFRFLNWRDLDWYRRMETCLATKQGIEREDLPAAIKAASYARLLSEQGRYAEAAAAYSIAIRTWESLSVSDTSLQNQHNGLRILREDLSYCHSQMRR